jgi:hypothetical protein
MARPPALGILLLPALLAALALTAGCGRDEAAPDTRAPGAAPGAAATAVAGTEPEHVAAEPSTAAEPEEIYFDLTAFDWYRQGQPLMHGGSGYLPRGDPRPVPAERLQRLDAYQGVNYYALEGDPRPPETVYVPVFHGYWQPFVTDAAGGAAGAAAGGGEPRR